MDIALTIVSKLNWFDAMQILKLYTDDLLKTLMEKNDNEEN